ncbi:oxidoreductase [uncultured Croceitalea sp.]|uniref:WD40/YVTN/BNR-like repeat-containing protein n=1 Tax=uncultured Croceitalea sp. TaxID=1798908 RepID=UPI00330578AC
MKKSLYALLLCTLFFSCTEQKQSHDYTVVTIETIFEDSVSIRAIEFLDANTLAFAGSKGIYGTVDLQTGKTRTNTMVHDSLLPEFRAVAHTNADFFMLSVADPALLYKTGDNGKMELVYKEEGEGVFYDAMQFWNDQEGIAIGDTTKGCLSIIITRDGGQTWNRLSCNQLPESIGNEGAFAASNTNIELIGDHTWIATTGGRLLFSADRGLTWTVQKTPIIKDKETQGIYSIDFYDLNNGYGIGGDFTEPDANKANKITTTNGGTSWSSIADGQAPGYKSCVQYIPNSGSQDLIAVGFTGVTYSNDQGASWKELTDEGFYTIRFLDKKTAYAAGKYRIAKLTFQ